MDQPKFCPTCGQPWPEPEPPPTGDRGQEPTEKMAGYGHFNRVQISDLTGDPFNDWPLIVARFEHTLPWLAEVIQSDPTTARYLRSQAEPEPEPKAATPSQLWQDLDAVRPHLAKVIQNGQFTYGHQSRIAEALGVPNQGSYRRRIQNVVRAMERTLIKPTSTSSTGPKAAPQTDSDPDAARAA